MSEGEEVGKSGKSGRPKVVKKSEVGNQRPEEKENNSAPDSYRDDIPNSESNKPEIVNGEALNEVNRKSEMEVHHHPEVEKKGLRQYLLEGLMIFVAVTMGFFAESLREHISDKERADEQAHSFYAELKSDSAAVTLAMKNWDRKNRALFYLKKYFEADSSLVNCSKAFSLNFYYAFRVNTPSRFEPKTVVLEQLKNSGSLRYFKSKELQRLTGELSVAIAFVRARNEIDNDYVETHINQFIIKYNDPLWYDKVNPHDDQVFIVLTNYEKSNLVVPFHFNNPAGFNRNESLNMIGDFQLILQASRSIMYKRYQVLNHTLLEALRKEYDLE